MAALIAWAGLAALWLPLLARWGRAWSAAPDQAYGWAVPLFAAWFFAARWRAAPPPPAPGSPGFGRTGAVGVFAGGLLLALLSLPVLEANALWPTAQWASAAGAIAATLGALAFAGGWRWAGRFAFPVAFILTSLTWPTPVKTWIVGTLAGTNARFAAEVVSAAGHPAVVSGNVIAVSTGQVGIEEACSGMRSLQAVWMVAWFAGEFFLLNWPRRLFLVGASLGAAVIVNIGRTMFLTWVAADRGLDASERWHDAAGNVELVLALAAVAALAWRAHRGRSAAASRRPEAPGPAAVLQRTRALAAIAVFAGVFAELGTQVWYRAHERRGGDMVRWQLAAPAGPWESVAVPAREKQVLGSTSAEGLAWAPGGGSASGWVFLVDWVGDASRGENPEWHDPAICLPAAGARLVAPLGTAVVPVGPRELAFFGYRFIAGGRPMTVYFCHWDAETARARAELSGPADDIRARRWQRVREGRRKGDVSHIAFLLSTDDAAAALAWVRRWAPALLKPAAA